MVNLNPTFNVFGDSGLTCVRKPFALLDELWLGSQRHEVPLYDKVGVLLTEEEGRSAGATRHGTIRRTLAFE